MLDKGQLLPPPHAPAPAPVPVTDPPAPTVMQVVFPMTLTSYGLAALIAFLASSPMAPVRPPLSAFCTPARWVLSRPSPDADQAQLNAILLDLTKDLPGLPAAK